MHRRPGNSLLPSRSIKRNRPVRKPFRLGFEALEDRLMMAGGGAAYQLAPAIVVGRAQAAPNDASGAALSPSNPVIAITRPPGSPYADLEKYVFAGSPFSVTAAIEDGQGQVLTSFEGGVTIALAANPAGATLGGTLTVTASNGIAAFSGLTLSQAGTGYTLKISADGADGKTAPFDVLANEILSIPESPTGPRVIASSIVKKRDALREIKIQFSQPMDLHAVTELENYALFDAGRDRVFGNRGDRRLRLKRATYDAATNSITLDLKEPVRLSKSLCLILNSQPSTGIRNATGQFLGGFRDWAPELNEMLFLGKGPRKVKTSFPEGDAAYLSRLRALATPWSVRLHTSLPLGQVVAPGFGLFDRSLDFTPVYVTVLEPLGKGPTFRPPGTTESGSGGSNNTNLPPNNPPALIALHSSLPLTSPVKLVFDQTTGFLEFTPVYVTLPLED
jgi:hypothetical protein